MDLIDHLNDTPQRQNLAPTASIVATYVSVGSQNCRRWQAQQCAGESRARRVTSSTRAAGTPRCCPTSRHPAQSLSGSLDSCCPGRHGSASSERRRSATSVCDSVPRSEGWEKDCRDCVYHAARCAMLHVTFATRRVEPGAHDKFKKRFGEYVSSGHHVRDKDTCPAATGRTATNLSRSYTADSSELPDPPETDISAGLQLRL